jgi:hypothetical protein
MKFSALERAQMRMERRTELELAKNEAIKKSEEQAKAKLGNVYEDDIEIEAYSIREQDEKFQKDYAIFESLNFGGCGDVEEACIKDGVRNKKNCKACQYEYLALMDADLEAEKTSLLEAMTREEKIERNEELYKDLQNEYRCYPEYLPTLLQKTHKG